MQIQRPAPARAWRPGIGSLAAVALFIGAWAPSAAALEFTSGQVATSLDTTFSYGAAWRVQDRDPKLIGIANGGESFSANSDDGNLNYGKGLVSNVAKVTSELQVTAGDAGLFLRAFAFYDYENERRDRDRTPLSSSARDRVGSRAEFLDAYVWNRWDVGGNPLQVRFGNQVLSWGESTFIQNGINILNPIDVAAIRVPGAELREALLPVGMVSGSLGLEGGRSLEAFYQFRWKGTEPEPAGSYFSTNDFASPGGDRVMLGFGQVPDLIPFGPNPLTAPVGAVVPRDPDARPSDSGQYGLAWRWLAPTLNDTEFGLYYINYHSRLPIVSARTGVPGPVMDPRTGAPAGLAAGDYAGSAGYFVEYPEDIRLLGASFAGALGTTGWAVQGEYSRKLDAPLQVDDIELLYAALSPLALVEAQAGSPGVGTLLAATNQVAPGGVGFNTVIPGYIERDVSQAQLTLTRLFGPALGADGSTFVVEGGVSRVHDMPSQSRLRLEVPGTATGGNPIHTAAGVQPATERASSFADATSWGYQLAWRLDYNNAIGAVNLQPTIGWRHDVSGNSPAPASTFIEGRRALTLGLRATYQSRLEAELSYTNFSGARGRHLQRDRDFVAFTLRYAL